MPTHNRGMKRVNLNRGDAVLIYAKRIFPLVLPAILILMLFSTTANATYFGKNSVQYTYFEWEYLTTEHFNIYYNQDGRKIADFTAEVAEQTYRELAQRFNYFPENPQPITIITYKSHNDFEQTNVAGGTHGESTGGFTEFLKNRVVVPYEGDYGKYRHVVHHELTHAFFLTMLFGEGFGAIVSGISQVRIPLWFIEGMAEYESQRGLDSETETVLRDAVINDILPEIRHLDMMGYLGVYKYGQSVLYYIAHHYGDEKIGEIVHHLRQLRDLDRTLKMSIGIGEEELSKNWRRFIKERYWPQVVEMDMPEAITQRMTNHEKEFCYVNNSPALSPNGAMIAFITDRSDYFDVYLMNSLDGKIIRRLVRGQRTGNFEELHWLRPGITWSPDGEKIAFCAKSGERDALYLIDVATGKMTRKITFEADALFSPSWSPNGDQIALIHVLNGQSDLAIVSLETGEHRHITHDLFDEADPEWTVNGKQILFTSNRDGAPLDYQDAPFDTPYERQFENFDIYKYDTENESLERLTNDDYNERTPMWIKDANSIVYVSDKSGTYNLYIRDLTDNSETGITNLVSGCFQPTISHQTGAMAFSSFSKSGYDIFMINDPLNPELHSEPKQLSEPEKIPLCCHEGQKTNSGIGDYSRYVFNTLKIKQEEPDSLEMLPDSLEIAQRTKDENGRYKSKDYSIQLSPDYVYLNAGYSPYYQMQGAGMVMFSDIIGNHQLYMSLDLNRSIEWSSIFLGYEYLAHRMNISTGFYQYANLYYGSEAYWLDRQMGVSLASGYPLSKFKRIDFGVTVWEVERKVFEDYLFDPSAAGSRRTSVLPHLGFIHDTAVWHNSVEPGNGSRWRVDAEWSPNIYSEDSERGLDFHTLSFDWRNYLNYKKDYSLATRISGAVSQGREPQRFYLGGMNNWFNYRIDEGDDVKVDDVEDIYLSKFVTPLRGVGFYNQIGTRYLLSNVEFRFPFIRHLMFGWPLPAYFYNIRGALFWDMGAAWKLRREYDPDEAVDQPADIDDLWKQHWTNGYGFGVRLDLGIFPIKWDVAWSKDPSSDMKPRYYFSINAGF